MVIADGFFAFLSEPVIVAVFRRITDYFRSVELAFNGYGRIGWFSWAAVKLAPQRPAGPKRRRGDDHDSRTRRTEFRSAVVARGDRHLQRHRTDGRRRPSQLGRP
jgi:hypothetical protein